MCVIVSNAPVTGDKPGEPPRAVHHGAPAVRLEGITKRFPGVVANKDISLTVDKGTVHAIVGENGAGKSTLMKSLYGMHQPDEGTIEVDGKPVVFHTPADAIAARVGGAGSILDRRPRRGGPA